MVLKLEISTPWILWTLVAKFHDFFFLQVFTTIFAHFYHWFPLFLFQDILMDIIRKVTENPSVPANLLTSIRLVTNLFKNSCFFNWLQRHRSEVIIWEDVFSVFLQEDSPCELRLCNLIICWLLLNLILQVLDAFSGCTSSPNKNIQLSLSTLILK